VNCMPHLSGDGRTTPTLDVAALLKARGRMDYPEARRALVKVLIAKGVFPHVAEAMGQVPRHAFGSRDIESLCYLDSWLATGDTVLSIPSVVGRMIQVLGLDKTKRVLDVGTGTGYQTAVLALLAQEVFTIERVRSSYEQSREAFRLLGLTNIVQRIGDGYAGWPDAAPFDAIIISTAPPQLPTILYRQLNPQGGRMVLPVGPPRGAQRLLLIIRSPKGDRRLDLGPTYFVPMIPGASAAR
jgi:protein-L-isoaspartate(D-aspartate) O-methyltransferase